MKKIVFISIFLFLLSNLYSQKIVSKYDYYKLSKEERSRLVAFKVIDGDTVLTVKMRPIYVFPPRKFKNKRQRRRYTRLVRNVKKVYPYSKIINNIFYESAFHVQTLDSKRDKKKYVKKKEKELKKKFEKIIRNMTYTQGRILIKLVDRETGHTSYEIIKYFKGSFTAFFWQAIARIFSTNLKYEYDAVEEDKMIEEIVARIENGQL